MGYKKIREFARENRKNPTPAEKFFWNKVRNRKLFGKKFNRQFIIEHGFSLNVINYFIVDFYCHEHRCIIELDGPIHSRQKGYDNERQDMLEDMGYKVIRFTNEKVLQEWDAVVNVLAQELSPE